MTPQGTRGSTATANPAFKAMTRVNTALYRLFRGLGMSSMLLLTTVGAKSGVERTMPLAYFTDGDDAWLIIASSGGAAKHPSWYVNLVKSPDKVWIQIGSRRLRVRPETLQGSEREERWQHIVARAAHFGRYQEQTDREIPVVRLTRSDS